MTVTLTFAGIAQKAREAYDAGVLQAQKRPGSKECNYSQELGPCAIGVSIEDQKAALLFDWNMTNIGTLLVTGEVAIEGLTPPDVYNSPGGDLILRLQATHDHWAGIRGGDTDDRAAAEAKFVLLLEELETYVKENAQ